MGTLAALPRVPFKKGSKNTTHLRNEVLINYSDYIKIIGSTGSNLFFTVPTYGLPPVFKTFTIP